MKKEVAMSRIKKAVERACPTESQQVKDYLVDLTYETFKGLELDYNACHDDGRPYTSTENLKYALSINLEDELGSLLEEARRETSKWYETPVKLVDENDSRSWCARELERLVELKKHRCLTVDEEETYWYCKSTLDSIEAERRYLNGESEW